MLVSGGLFSVGLGSQTNGGIPTSAWNGDRYLEITVGGETLSPRELIRSVPIAGMALSVCYRSACCQQPLHFLDQRGEVGTGKGWSECG